MAQYGPEKDPVAVKVPKLQGASGRGRREGKGAVLARGQRRALVTGDGRTNLRVMEFTGQGRL